MSRKRKKLTSLIAFVAVLSAGNCIFSRTPPDEFADGDLMRTKISLTSPDSPNQTRGLTPKLSFFIPVHNLPPIPDAGRFFLTGMVLVGIGRVVRHGKG